MSFISQLKAGIVGALICCGAAPVPGGFIVFIWMIINLCGVPEHVDMDKLHTSLSVLLAINWFMDRCRTSVNIIGDSVVAGIVESRIYGPQRAFEAPRATTDPLGGPAKPDEQTDGALTQTLSGALPCPHSYVCIVLPLYSRTYVNALTC
jgi:hypothetical protein